MEIRIGIKQSPRELQFKTGSTADEVRALIDAAVKDDAQLLALSDVKGNQYLVDTDSIAYIELGSDSGHKVGFVS